MFSLLRYIVYSLYTPITDTDVTDDISSWLSAGNTTTDPTTLIVHTKEPIQYKTRPVLQQRFVYIYVPDPDSRPSAVALGVMGWILVAVEMALVLLIDIHNYQQGMYTYDKTKKVPRRGRRCRRAETTV